MAFIKSTWFITRCYCTVSESVRWTEARKRIYREFWWRNF